MIACRSCNRQLQEGESAWAEDWTVLDVSGSEASWRTEVRYTCEGCTKS